jgi:hypothetical protein
MTAATSEYAMLDSMFAMDPVFPGLGGLDNLDQPLSLDQQYISPNWTNDNNNNHTQSIQSQSHPVHPTFSMPNPPSDSMNQRHRHSADAQIQGHHGTLPAPPTFDMPSSPWSTWLNGQGGQTPQAQAQAQTLDDGMTAGGLLASGMGNGTGQSKRTMNSSEVYKKVTKP